MTTLDTRTVGRVKETTIARATDGVHLTRIVPDPLKPT